MIGKNLKCLINMCDMNLDEIDFLNDATNVYRTEEYIVSQHITFCTGGLGVARLLSEDTFYSRTKKRDSQYEKLFVSDGKRIHSSMSVRTYIE